MSKFKNVKDQLALGLTQNPNLKEIPEQIGNQGGMRSQLMDHAGDAAARKANSAGTLSDMMTKIAENRKLQAALKMAKSPVGKKMIAGIAGPVGLAMSTAQDAMASEDVGLGSDQVDNLQNEEALMNIPHENFADPAVAEQARRWQKIRGMMP